MNAAARFVGTAGRVVSTAPRVLLAAAMVLGVPAATAAAQGVEAGAEVEASVRAFPADPLFPGQQTAALSPSVVLSPDFELEWSDRRWRLVGEGFARLDAHDGRRSHVDIRELGVSYFGDRFTAFAGVGQVFWGVNEVRHLVDVVNQVDGVEDLDGEDKLGQPMVSVTLESHWAVLDLYYLPYFRERTFPDHDARLRGSLPIDGDPRYPNGGGRWDGGVAARAFRTFGAVDLGLSYFGGTSREPAFEVVVAEGGQPQARPRYDRIDQWGTDLQWTGERTLLKLEAMTRGGHGDRLYAASGGIEYTLYQVLGSDGDLGLLSEITFDSRGEGAPSTLFEHDLFLGGRWALNDPSDTSVLGGPLIDLSTGEVLAVFEAERRLGSAWRLSLDGRLFWNTDPSSRIHGIHRDGFLALSLVRYF